MSVGKASVQLVAFSTVVAFAGVGLAGAPAHAQPQPKPGPAAVAAAAGTVAAQTRGDIVGRRGVPVMNVTVSKSGRLVSALVFWNQAMIARAGHRDRFNVRLVAFGAGGAANRLCSTSALPASIPQRSSR